MVTELFANNAATTLSAGCASGDVTIAVASSTGFPTPSSGKQFRIIIGTELLIVTAISGATWTVTRGAESTTAAAHSLGDTVTHIVTKAALDAFGDSALDLTAREVGKYSMLNGMGTSTGATLNTVTSMLLLPFFLHEDINADRAWINCTAAQAGGNHRVWVGLYQKQSLTLDTLTKVADFGSFDVATTGDKINTGTWTAPRGTSYLAFLADAGGLDLGLRASVPVSNGHSGPCAPISGGSETLWFDPSAFFATVTAGSLPTTATIADGFQQNFPRCAIRRA